MPGARLFALVLIFFIAAPLAFGDFLWFKIRNPVRDVEKIVKVKLTGEETALVEIVMAFYALKYGYAKEEPVAKEALKKMSDKEYEHAVAQAAKICMNDVAKGFYRVGKGGEKLLKAIIQTAEDAAKAAGSYIEKQSNQYDKKK
jgi:hypothetical protein